MITNPLISTQPLIYPYPLPSIHSRTSFVPVLSARFRSNIHFCPNLWTSGRGPSASVLVNLRLVFSIQHRWCVGGEKNISSWWFFTNPSEKIWVKLWKSSPRRGENTKKIETTKQISYEWLTCLYILVLTCVNLCCFMLYALPSLGLVRQNSLEQGSCCQNSRHSKAGATTRNHRTNTHPETYITQCHLPTINFQGLLCEFQGRVKVLTNFLSLSLNGGDWIPPPDRVSTQEDLWCFTDNLTSPGCEDKNGSSRGNPGFQGKKPRLLLRCMARAPKKTRHCKMFTLHEHSLWNKICPHNLMRGLWGSLQLLLQVIPQHYWLSWCVSICYLYIHALVTVTSLRQVD